MAFQAPESEIDLKNVQHRQEGNPVLTKLNSIKAKGILNSATHKENEPELQTLTFKRTTEAQEKTRKQQQPGKLEPLVSSERKNHTHTHHPQR